MPQGYKTCPECNHKHWSGRHKCHCGYNFINPQQREAARQIQNDEEFDKHATVAALYPLKSHTKEQLEFLADGELATVCSFVAKWGTDLEGFFRTAKAFNNDYEQVSRAARSLLSLQI